MKKLAQVVGVALIFAALAVPAQGSHPTQICLDVEPDRAYPEAPGGQIDRLTAHVGATDDDHEEPHQEGCVISDGDDFQNTNIDFEVTGAGDPDSADSPETPDLSCTVPPDSNHCEIVPPEASGEQTIAVWIDFDDSTVELDRDEQVDDEDTDATDVTLWSWSRCSGCIDLTIEFNPNRNRFLGEVIEHYANCYVDRLIKLWRVRADTNKLWGKTRSGRFGKWHISPTTQPHGRFFAIAPRIFVDGYHCPRIESDTIRTR